MARYFFNVYHGSSDVDQDGRELSDDQTVWRKDGKWVRTEQLWPPARAAPRRTNASASGTLSVGRTLLSNTGESVMAKAKKQSSRGRKQDRARVAGGQDYQVRYEAKKTSKSKADVKKAVKKVGSSRKRVERTLAR